MKKTLIALMALAGVAMADSASTSPSEYVLNPLVEYTFANSSLAPTGGSEKDAAATVRASGWEVSDGMVTCTTQGNLNGYYSGSNSPIFSTNAENWAVTLVGTFSTGGTTRAMLQLGSSDYASAGYGDVYGLYWGNGKDDWGVVGIAFKSSCFALTSSTVSSLGLTLSGASTEYTIMSYNGELHFLVNDTDVTSYLTQVRGNSTTLQSEYSKLNETGVALAKFGYANELSSVALGGLDQGSVISYVGISTVTPSIPEPATATLSLLALAGLAARRRRK